MQRRQFLTATSLGAAALAVPDPAAGSVRAVAPMRAGAADALCRSYLVNTKIFHAPTVYGHTEAVVELLKELGVRTVRERVTTGTSDGTRNQLWAFPRLAAAGIRWHGTVGELDDWRRSTAANRSVMQFLATRYAPRVDGDLSALMHSFGGCNEVDGPVVNGHRDRRWAEHARIMQRALWREAKANRRTRDIPVAGPSTRTDVTARRAERLGDLSQWSEWGNGHLYNKGSSPTREIDGHLRTLRRCFPHAERWIMTETGYNNSPQDNLGVTVPEEASAVYALRGICDFFKRNTIYGRFELLDDPDAINRRSQQTINRTAEREAHFGLVAMTRSGLREARPETWRKKPEFHATRRLLHLLADEGRAFSPDPLRVRIDGGGDRVQRLLLQKRDGRHFLLLWRDVEVCKPYPSGRMRTVSPVTLDVRLATARPLAVHVPNEQSGPVDTRPARRSHRIQLRGAVKVLELG